MANLRKLQILYQNFFCIESIAIYDVVWFYVYNKRCIIK